MARKTKNTTSLSGKDAYKLLRDQHKQKQLKKELYDNKEWYTIRALLGNQWANWFVLIGARER